MENKITKDFCWRLIAFFFTNHVITEEEYNNEKEKLTLNKNIMLAVKIDVRKEEKIQIIMHEERRIILVLWAGATNNHKSTQTDY